jgi:hypothetical protein
MEHVWTEEHKKTLRDSHDEVEVEVGLDMGGAGWLRKAATSRA